MARKAKEKPNALTIETRREWAQAERDGKNGRYNKKRGQQRMFEWAAWRAAQDGVELPTEAKATLCGNRVEWRLEVQDEPKEIRRGTWRHFALRTVIVAAVEIPAYCYPVDDAEKWMAAYCQRIEGEDESALLAA